MRILFVCNANIVRSFMAERILKSRLERHGVRDVEVGSAGLLDMNGVPADETARGILRESGIHDEDHHSRLLTEALIAEADLVVTMERGQALKIGDQYPEAVAKVKVLKSFLTNCGQGSDGEDVTDPYRRSIFHYRLCFADISLAVEELRKCI